MTARTQRRLPSPSGGSSRSVQLAGGAGGPMATWATPSNSGSQFQRQLGASSPQLQLSGDDKKSGPVAGTASGLANYESTLGKLLGGKLYEAVSKEISLSKLSGHAESGLKSALGSLGGKLKDADGVDPAEVDKAVAALKTHFGKEAGKFVKANGGGLQRALQGFVDANPELIVLLALLAAAGAIAADLKVPQLKAKLGITDNLDASLSVQLGTLQNIALKKIEAKLKYTAGSLKATVAVAYEEEEAKARLDLRYGLRPGLDLTGRTSWGEEEGFGARLGMEYKPNDRLSIGAHVGYDDDKGANAGVGVTLRF